MRLDLMAAKDPRRISHVAVLALVAASVLSAAALAQAPAKKEPMSLKEVLGKAQSDAESKAVEDLIGKLKGTARKPAEPPPASAPAPAPASPPPAIAAPAAPAPPPATTPEPAPPAVTAPPSIAAPSPPSVPGTPPARDGMPFPPPGDRVAAPATPKADLPAAPDTVDRAQRESPSIDLEVQFAYKSDELTSEAAAALRPLGRALQDPRLASDAFLIAGHTDAKGGPAYNLELSQRRAESVRKFLIDNFRLDATKLVAKGYGQQRLKTPAQPFAAENRRVQIVNLTKSK